MTLQTTWTLTFTQRRAAPQIEAIALVVVVRHDVNAHVLRQNAAIRPDNVVTVDGADRRVVVVVTVV